MISKEPLESPADPPICILIVCLPSMSEIPQAAGNGNEKLSAADYESANPEESEEVVDPDVAGRVIPLHVCEDGLALAAGGISH
jgi:hypothetical protein